MVKCRLRLSHHLVAVFILDARMCKTFAGSLNQSWLVLIMRGKLHAISHYEDFVRI